MVGTILIVDDHVVFRIGLERILADSLPNRSVVAVGTFKAAMAELERRPFSLAIFDLGLPDLDDTSQFTDVRRRCPTMRLVVLSARQGRDDILAALEAGVHGYMLKSDGIEQFVERLEKVMSGEIYVPPAIAQLPTVPDGMDAALTPRQRQMLSGLVDGLTNKQIARVCGISEGTVKMHLASLFRTVGASNRTQAAVIGRQIVRT